MFGIIWHTQGSGKSLTMVWLTKWIRGFNPDARVLIVTDRIDLINKSEVYLLASMKKFIALKTVQI